MKTIGNVDYYSKQEIAEQIGCSLNTINARVSAAKIRGYYFGHTKYYTTEQIQQILEYGRVPQSEQ